MKENLFGKTLAELAEVAAGVDLPRFAARQMAGWLYDKGVVSIGEMTNISAAGRAALGERYEVGRSVPVRESASKDGTKKYLFSTTSSLPLPCEGGVSRSDGVAGLSVESVMIPDGERRTLCLSSQSGCRMGCAFCATGRMGLAANLSAGEILNQFASLPERPSLTNVVYMGMGEPLDNLDAVLKSLEILTADWGYAWSPTRITISTAGVAPALERFLEASNVHLAVSLHNPFSDERAAIMPIEKAYPIEQITDLVRKHFLRSPLRPCGTHQRRVSFEYIVLAGMNDSPRHVAGLAKLLGGLSCRINLIRFHKIPDSPFFSPPLAEVERFRDALVRKGLRTTIRASRGEDIEAACGLLSSKN